MRHFSVLLLLAVAAVSASHVRAQELVLNGGFDRGLSGWGLGPPFSEIGLYPYWANEDALGNPQSGSAVTPSRCSFTGCYTTGLTQCVPVEPDHAYRLSLHQLGSEGELTVIWYPSVACSGGWLPASVREAMDHTKWTQSAFLMTAPSDARSFSLNLGGRQTALWDYVSLQKVGPFSETTRVALIVTAASVEGRFGAVYRTRVTLLSLATQPFSAVLQVLPAAGALGPSRVVTLLPGSTMSFEDLLGTLAYRGGAAIAVTYPIDQPLYVTAEVYADSPAGRYTTAVPVLYDPLNDHRAATPGIRNSASSRTNIGCTSLDSETVEAAAAVHAMDGTPLGTIRLSVPAYGWTQTAVPFDVTDGYVLWEAPGSLQCFAINVDNGTNDGTLLR